MRAACWLLDKRQVVAWALDGGADLPSAVESDACVVPPERGSGVERVSWGAAMAGSGWSVPPLIMLS